MKPLASVVKSLGQKSVGRTWRLSAKVALITIGAASEVVVVAVAVVEEALVAYVDVAHLEGVEAHHLTSNQQSRQQLSVLGVAFSFLRLQFSRASCMSMDSVFCSDGLIGYGPLSLSNGVMNGMGQVLCVFVRDRKLQGRLAGRT
jgi:hypothetical protein